MDLEKLEEEINYVFTEEKGRTALLVQLEIARQLKRVADYMEEFNKAAIDPRGVLSIDAHTWEG